MIVRQGMGWIKPPGSLGDDSSIIGGGDDPEVAKLNAEFGPGNLFSKALADSPHPAMESAGVWLGLLLIGLFAAQVALHQKL